MDKLNDIYLIIGLIIIPDEESLIYTIKDCLAKSFEIVTNHDKSNYYGDGYNFSHCDMYFKVWKAAEGSKPQIVSVRITADAINDLSENESQLFVLIYEHGKTEHQQLLIENSHGV